MKRIVIIVTALALVACSNEKESSVPSQQDLQEARDEWETTIEAGKAVACEMFKEPEMVEALLDKHNVSESQKAARFQVLEEEC